MTELFLTYTEYSRGGDPHDPDDRWTSHDPVYVTFEPKEVYLDRETVPHWLVETIECSDDIERGDTVGLVTIRYSTGNTFITEHGQWMIDGIYKDLKKAAEIANDIRLDGEYENYKDRRYAPNDLKEPDGYPRYPGVARHYEGYKPWTGYFESFEGVDVSLHLVL